MVRPCSYLANHQTAELALFLAPDSAGDEGAKATIRELLAQQRTSGRASHTAYFI